jgi:hypothetical protein
MLLFEWRPFPVLGVMTLLVVSGSSPTFAQVEGRPGVVESDEHDHAVIYEVGAVGSWSRAEGFHPGVTFAFEVTPIERWLELEIGFTAIRGDATIEMPIDVLFKKPWQISRTFEFMIGVGPELIHATGREGGTFWGVSSVLDFMFWPRKNVGWYVEPSYEVTFRHGATHRGLGLTAGLLIGR